jgi:hypothetical protein
MIILGGILLIVGILAYSQILQIIGLILLAVGLALLVLGLMGRPPRPGPKPLLLGQRATNAAWCAGAAPALQLSAVVRRS